MGKNDRFIRPLRVWFALQSARRGLTVSELVERLPDIPQRSIYRYLDTLREGGFEVRQDGHRFVVPSASAVPFPLDDDEVVALSIALQRLPTSLREPLGALAARLEATLTPARRTFLAQMRGIHHSTAPGTAAGPVDTSLAEVVRFGLRHEQVVRIGYASVDGTVSTRDVEPYGVLVAAGDEHVVGRCRTRQAIRQFAMSRIRSAEVLDVTFEPDSSFDLDAFARAPFSAWSGEILHVAILLDARVAYLARERLWHATQQVEERPDGAVVLRFEASGLFEIAAFAAGLGGSARVLGPPELVARVTELHEQGLARLRNKEEGEFVTS